MSNAPASSNLVARIRKRYAEDWAILDSDPSIAQAVVAGDLEYDTWAEIMDARESISEIERLRAAIKLAIERMTEEGLEGTCLWDLRESIEAAPPAETSEKQS